jgi:hypothetical protein
MLNLSTNLVYETARYAPKTLVGLEMVCTTIKDKLRRYPFHIQTLIEDVYHIGGARSLGYDDCKLYLRGTCHLYFVEINGYIKVTRFCPATGLYDRISLSANTPH